jgi:aspartyl-tRNA(Asn)/glutamyl-tRNA(Gln) amidotransferase subunit A
MPTSRSATFQEAITLSKELLTKSATEVGELIRIKDVSPVDVTRALLDHAHSLNDDINAYVSFRDDAALDEAKNAEKEIVAGQHRGPLHGVPMALKDNLYVAGEVTTMASKIHGNFVSKDDATVVSKLRDAGVVLTGKLNMHEYAWGIDNDSPHFGAVHNPWNLDKVPGGSSGGSGAAVAADMSFVTLGTDTAGSIRIPSSACGLVGLKPTHGRVAKFGCYPLAWTLDHIGPMAKTVADAAAMLQAIAGFDHRDPTSIDVPVGNYVNALGGDPAGLVIGIEEDYFFRDVDSEVERLVRARIEDLVARGAKVKKISIPALRYSEWTELATSLSEASAIHHQDLIDRPGDFGSDIRFLFYLGELFSSVDYLQAQQARRQIKKEFHAALADVDVMMAPTLPVMAPDIGSAVADLNGSPVDLVQNFIRFTGPSNLTGLPALTVPAGLNQGLPVGLQIIGKAFDEATVLRVGGLVEESNPMQGERAPRSA